MTEDDAKTKWCPMTRIGDMNVPTGINRGNNSNNKCIASDCMVWKFTDTRTKDGYGNARNPEGQCGLINS